MSARKRRSNRLTVEQFEAKSDLRERDQNSPTVMIGFGQDHLDWWDSLYRTMALRVALQMVREGEAEKLVVETPNGETIMFRELKPIAGAQYSLPMMPNAASADALASYAPGARLDARRQRRVDNVLMFPFVGDRKAPLTGPRVSEHDFERARKLMGVRPATAGHCYRPIGVLRNELAAAA